MSNINKTAFTDKQLENLTKDWNRANLVDRTEPKYPTY